MARTTPRKGADLNSPTPPSPTSPTPTHPKRTTAASASSPVPRGPLPPSSETSYHKRLRGLLLEHKRCRKEWTELVLRGCLARTRAAIEIWAEVECVSLLCQEKGRRSERSYSVLSCLLRNGLKHIDGGGAGHSTQKNAVRAGYLFTQSAKLSDQLSTISGVLASLVSVFTGPCVSCDLNSQLTLGPGPPQTELLATMNQIAERAENLTIEAAKTRGTAFAFRDPLWATWPLSRFCLSFRRFPLPLVNSLIQFISPADGIQDLTSHYGPSLILIHTLIETLTTFPPLPTGEPVDKKEAKSNLKLRPKPEEIQAAMSLLAVQPLLPGKGGDGAEAWEEFMAVEVGGWADGR